MKIGITNAWNSHLHLLSFLNNVFGLTMAEIPVAPKDAKVPLPVKTIAMGWGDEKGETGNVPVEK